MTIAAGIDVGTSAVKVALFQVEHGTETKLAGRVDRILRRNPLAVAEESYLTALGSAGLDKDQVDYIATTGEGDLVEWRRGHFYTMTTHARGARFLVPE
ncbi:MAG TPA: BadF/BadG/BcrA/BcrD ATPase family protein, partial [bacterium]